MHNILIHNNDPDDIYTWLNELEDDEFSNMDDPDSAPPEEIPLHNSVPLGAHKVTRHKQMKMYIRETFICLYKYNTPSGGEISNGEDSSGNDTYS